MAARKANKSARRRAPKKSAPKKTTVRGSSKAPKRARRAGKAGPSAGPRKASVLVKPPRIEVVTGASMASSADRERKPAKKVNRPAAALPIPQSTFFF
jgi:hypothetical protein